MRPAILETIWPVLLFRVDWWIPFKRGVWHKLAKPMAKASCALLRGNVSNSTGSKLPAPADMLRDLAKDNLSSFHGCGDVTRNVAACPLAETCQYKRINVLPFAKETSKDVDGSS